MGNIDEPSEKSILDYIASLLTEEQYRLVIDWFDAEDRRMDEEERQLAERARRVFTEEEFQQWLALLESEPGECQGKLSAHPHRVEAIGNPIELLPRPAAPAAKRKRRGRYHSGVRNKVLAALAATFPSGVPATQSATNIAAAVNGWLTKKGG